VASRENVALCLWIYASYVRLRQLCLVRPNPHWLNRLRKKYLFCHSERSEESLFDCKYNKIKEGEILRFAQNGRTSSFSAACEAYAT
jgi:hypothetical protein